MNQTDKVWSLLLLVLAACERPLEPKLQVRLPPLQQGGAPPKLSHVEVMERFWSRSTAEDVRRFQALVVRTDDASQVRALEMVLFKLTGDELFDIGVTQAGEPGPPDWAVAWSKSTKAVQDVIVATLDAVHIDCGMSANLGMAGWYVPRDKFFLASHALYQSSAVRELGVDVVTPKFRLRVGEPPNPALQPTRD